MPNSIAYLLNNNKKSDRTVQDGGASLVFTWSAAGGWCCCCLLPLPAATTTTARPAYTNTLHRRTIYLNANILHIFTVTELQFTLNHLFHITIID